MHLKWCQETSQQLCREIACVIIRLKNETSSRINSGRCSLCTKSIDLGMSSRLNIYGICGSNDRNEKKDERTNVGKNQLFSSSNLKTLYLTIPITSVATYVFGIIQQTLRKKYLFCILLYVLFLYITVKCRLDQMSEQERSTIRACSRVFHLWFGWGLLFLW